MKKTYETPQMTVHGDIEKITNAFGDSSADDIAFGPDGKVITNPTGFESGSVDGVFGTCSKKVMAAIKLLLWL